MFKKNNCNVKGYLLYKQALLEINFKCIITVDPYVQNFSIGGIIWMRNNSLINVVQGYLQSLFLTHLENWDSVQFSALFVCTYLRSYIHCHLCFLKDPEELLAKLQKYKHEQWSKHILNKYVLELIIVGFKNQTKNHI